MTGLRRRPEVRSLAATDGNRCIAADQPKKFGFRLSADFQGGRLTVNFWHEQTLTAL
jgi:hypothetical protein